ncbi:hypothetical protein BH09ACT12_BH09ACT12_32070 [soil metagenome]
MKSPARPPHSSPVRTGIARAGLAACALLIAAPLAAAPPVSAASAAAPTRAAAAFVDLGSAASYSVLAGAGVSNTGADTVLALDLGLSPAGVIAGFPPGTVTGTVHDKDAAAETAAEDRQSAYDATVAQTGGTPFAGDQAGATFKPGLYTSPAALTNTGTITLDADGDSGGIFVFQIGGALSSAAVTKVVLTDGALANNVYWQVNGAVSLGAGAKFVGTFLATGAISFGEGASLKGRALTPSTVALANSPVTKPIDDLTAPIVTIDGGPTASTNDATPSISGTTDEPAGRPVTVTVADQTLSATVDAGGSWVVGTSALSEGPHDVVATITDPSQNVGTATQVLTVDLTDPLVTLDGGDTRATKDRTPSISGTTDQPGKPTVVVRVAGQRLTTKAGADGAWSVTTATLKERTFAVVASVDDTAGNTGQADQTLTVDVTKPVIAIDGGAERKTQDTSPWTYGTSGEKAGTVVTVGIGTQRLTTEVLSDGTWGVSAKALPKGTYRVVASITDAAQNTTQASQLLTIGHASDPIEPGPVGPGPVDPGTRYRPDAAIRHGKGAFVGVEVYGHRADQRITSKLKHRTRRAKFQVSLTNRGNAGDRLSVQGTSRNEKFRAVYRSGGKNVTRAVTAGTFRTQRLAVGESARLILRVTRTRAAHHHNRRVFRVWVASGHSSRRRDMVTAVVKR